MPVPNGGLQMEWIGQNGELEIEVRPNGTYSILHVTPDGSYLHPGWENDPTIAAMKELIAEVLG